VSLGQGPGAVHTYDGINWLPGAGLDERDEPTIDDLEAMKASLGGVGQHVGHVAFWKEAARLARLTAVWRDDPMHVASMTTTADDPALVALAAAHAAIDALLRRGQRMADAIDQVAIIACDGVDDVTARCLMRHVADALASDREDLVRIGATWKGAMACRPGG
jgi:hypothetical protein